LARDVKVFVNSASGSRTEALHIDSSQNATFAGNVSLADSKILRIGSSNDLDLLHDGTNTQISNNTGDLQIINNADDKDIRFFSDDGSGGTTEYFRLDGSAEVNVFSKNISLNGNHTITNDSNGHLNINSASGKQIFIDAQGQLRLDSGGSQALTLDSSQNATFAGNVSLADTKQLILGNANDFSIVHDGTETFIANDTGNLTIVNNTDDGDIVFKSDDGSGGTATYFFLDGSEVRTTFNKEARFIDSAKLKLGDSGDLEIYHDGSNSYIDEVGTGSLFIRGSDIFIKANATEDAIIARANAEVELYHNGSEKFATTSTGATVTGDLGITGALSKGSGSFKIDHPVKPDTHYLYHSFVESPLTDLIYRGKTKLTNGKGSINIDRHFGMTEGTFVALIDDKQVFTTNEDSWDAVRGKIQGNELHIECQNKDFDGYVSWLVIGDRKDKHIIEVDWTDDKGKPILEIEK
jgi:hypothetical protein